MTDIERVFFVFTKLSYEDQKKAGDLIQAYRVDSWELNQPVKKELETKAAQNVGTFGSAKCPYCNR